MTKLAIGLGTILHELGHVLGYALSNSLPGAELGEIQSVEIGNNKNCVTPKKGIYHFENGDIDKIIENTKNIPRTLAWFVEVLLGCAVHCLYERRAINSCFAPAKNGNQDFMNMAAIRTLSSFKWKFDEIDTLSSDLIFILQNRKVLDTLTPIAERILMRLVSIEGCQLNYIDDELKELVADLDNSIDVKLKQDFQTLIERWTTKYTNPKQ